jgi:hypothetical protein
MMLSIENIWRINIGRIHTVAVAGTRSVSV